MYDTLRELHRKFWKELPKPEVSIRIIILDSQLSFGAAIKNRHLLKSPILAGALHISNLNRLKQ